MDIISDFETINSSKIKIISITINRDLAINKKIKVDLSKHNISVVFGENGCGKTTLLRCINAFLSQNESILQSEKVDSMSIDYRINDEIKTVGIRKIEITELIEDEVNRPIEFVKSSYDWSEYSNSELKGMRSILFGVNRGISNNLIITEEDIYNTLIRLRYSEKFESRSEIFMFCHALQRNIKRNQINRRGRKINDKFGLSEPVLTIDSITMEVIENLLVERYVVAKQRTNSMVRNALFNTLADACYSTINDNINISQKDYRNLLLTNKDKLILALNSGTQNTLSRRIVDILGNISDNSDLSEIGNNPLLKKLIFNMSHELNRESELLQAVEKLTEVFNEYIGPEKYLIITEENAIIRFKNSTDEHGLEALSSGEKHLLVLLTVFVIEGSKRDLFMVDEPEISLNMRWQKKILPLLHELSPNSEIIVASHSPSIANANSEYLVELERQNEV